MGAALVVVGAVLLEAEEAVVVAEEAEREDWHVRRFHDQIVLVCFPFRPS
jgi:hypothetical protein